MGRPPHGPTEKTRRLVEHHAAIGTLQEHIAKLLGISVNTLKKHYREELELGLVRAPAVATADGGSAGGKDTREAMASLFSSPEC